MTRPIPAAEFALADAAIDDCWKRIGIRGDKSCPELARHVHCRDCPTFSLAAATLLDRDLADDDAAFPARRPAAGPAAGEARTKTAAGEAETECAAIFRVGQEWFALPTAVLDEIVGPRGVHSLPHRRNPALLGLINVRGELVVCVSIAPLLIGAAQGAIDGRLIIIRHPGGRFACPVDEVQHTHHYSPAQLEPVPATVGRSVSSLTKGLLSWRDRTVARLDERLLFDALARSLS
jgi:chemotaxis-related protein WspD